MLVGMIALTGQWWLEARSPKKQDVAAHLVNLAWNGLHGLERSPVIDDRKKAARAKNRADDDALTQAAAQMFDALYALPPSSPTSPSTVPSAAP